MYVVSFYPLQIEDDGFPGIYHNFLEVNVRVLVFLFYWIFLFFSSMQHNQL